MTIIRRVVDPWRETGPLTDKLVERLSAPERGNRLKYDRTTKGFACRVTDSGSKAFVLRYKFDGRSRVITIGDAADFTVDQARDKASEFRRQIRDGVDPLAQREDRRAVVTVNQLCDRFIAEHLPKLREATAHDYKGIIAQYIRPEFGNRKVTDIKLDDVDTLHNRIRAAHPYRANRVAAVVSRMFALGIRWRMAVINPAVGLEKAPEQPRATYLAPEQVHRLLAVLHPEQQSANILRLIVYTGCRRGEALHARWDQFKLQGGAPSWVKQPEDVKQNRQHAVPLSPQAVALLKGMRAKAGVDAVWLFPSDSKRGPQTDIKKMWAAVSAEAGIDCRVHDLRHTVASAIISGGASLSVVAEALGHSQISVSARYAHLYDSVTREAMAGVGKLFTAPKTKRAKPTSK